MALRVNIKKYETKIRPGDFPKETIGDLISEPVDIFYNNELVAIYRELPKEIYNISKVITKNTKPVKSSRTIGVPQLSTVYGALPRIAIREDYCRYSKKSKEERKNFYLALELNKKLSEYYKEYFPEKWKNAINFNKENILKDYRPVETPWTNINVNVNQVIKYHRDSGNNKQDLSNVLIIKNGVTGGHLSMPEYNISLHQGDGFMVFFKGQDILHGVTPCNFTSKESYRCSIVNYTLHNLKHCYPYGEELQRVKEVKTRQAKNRLSKNQELRKGLEKRKKNRAIKLKNN